MKTKILNILEMNSNILSNSIDKTQIPPLHQKRILAFVNHFVISSCSFLNDFASKCETKFIEVERKMQKVEASLIIIEAKLSSIPDLSDINKNVGLATTKPVTEGDKSSDQEQPIKEAKEDEPITSDVETLPLETETGVMACDDSRYKKFFKMLQFGVPINAVKMKMQAEGFDSTIIDTPNLRLPDGVSS